MIEYLNEIYYANDSSLELCNIIEGDINTTMSYIYDVIHNYRAGHNLGFYT